MAGSSEGKYDLKLLMMMKELNIRNIAAKEPLSLAQYYDRIDSFMREAPLFVDSLNDIVVIKNGTFLLNKLPTYKNIQTDINLFLHNELKRFRDILIGIGSEKFMSQYMDMEKYIHADGGGLRNELAVKLSSSHNSGYDDLRNELIMNVSHNINELFMRIKKTYSWNYTQEIKEGDAESAQGAVRLAQAIVNLEHIEATRKKRILAVDDMPAILNAITAVLSERYEVSALTRSDQVIKFLRANMPDLFLLDIEMPGMDGYTLFKTIRDLDEHKETPIMFLTGNASNTHISTAVSMGAAGFIKKPVDQVTLLTKIESTLAARKNLF